MRDVRTLLRQYCVECHGEDSPEANVDLQEITSEPEFGRHFKDWEKVARVLGSGDMPPADMPQPEESQRQALITAIETGLDRYIAQNAGDPGAVVVRRLTSAEYGYTIEDLTGLNLDVSQGFVSDAVGGEGFTNVGSAQFVQDSTLERYLEAAKSVAAHAVIGSGPLEFFTDPGETGRELSAITRIQRIYREHGFRTAAGEGAEPFGLDLYPRAMFVAWQFRFREQLGLRGVPLQTLAAREGLGVRFCEHLWTVLNQSDAPFPLILICSGWQDLPPPSQQSPETIRARCDELSVLLRDWQSTLAAAAGDEEEASVLTAGEVHIAATHSLRADLSWAEGARVAEFELSVSPASNRPAHEALVIWRKARVRFRREDRRRDAPEPLSPFVSSETANHLGFGTHPAGAVIGPEDFVLPGESASTITLRIPPGRTSAELFVDVELDTSHGTPSIVRCRIADGEVEGETAAEVGATSTLLADPKSEFVDRWRAGVAEFANLLPEVSHREPPPPTEIRSPPFLTMPTTSRSGITFTTPSSTTGTMPSSSDTWPMTRHVAS